MFVLDTINAALTRAADLLLAPFSAYPRCGLVFWAAVSGVVMTYVFGKTSSQRRLRRVTDQTRAQLLAIKLFKDDLNVTMKCQIALLKATGWRLLLSVPPMFVMLVPFLIILIQLAQRYEFQPLRPGEPTLVRLELDPQAWDQFQTVALETPAGVVAETEALRDPSNHALYWRIKTLPEAAARASLGWTFGQWHLTKQLVTAGQQTAGLPKVSIRRAGGGLVDRLLYPVEAGLPRDGPVRGIDVGYAARRSPILGVDLPWWATFFIVSMVAAVLVRRRMGVKF